MGAQAQSAQGTLIARAPAATPTSFTTIGELRNITFTPLMRNVIDMTAHNDTEETFVMGIRRKGELKFQIGFAPSGEATHGATSGLVKAIEDNSRDVYRITFPDATKITFSGYVTNVGVTAPVDGALTADVTIRPTGASVWS